MDGLRRMKVIFLDFDGVLNSVQEVYYKINRKERSLYWRLREKLGHKLYFRYKKVLTKDGYTHKLRKDPFGILDAISNFSHDHVVDHAEFCPIACSNVQYILKENPDVFIVVSSVWRSSGLKRLRAIAKRNGIDPSRIIDVTPYDHENEHGYTLEPDPIKGCYRGEERYMGRGTQIQAWLNRKGQSVTHFAIIDDDADMVHLMPKLVQTDGNMGFMWDKAMQVIKMLEGKGEARCG
jgi:hypothetical protein